MSTLRTDQVGMRDIKVPRDAPSRVRDRLSTGTLYSFIAIIVAQSFALATSIIYARLLGKDNLGVLAIYVQLSNLVMAFVGLGLSTATVKFVAQFRKADRAKLEPFLSTVFTITVLSSLVVTVAFLISADALGLSLYSSPELAVMVRLSSIFLIFNGLAYFGSAVLQGFQSIRTLSLVSIFIEGVTVPITFFSLVAFGLVGAVVAGIVLIVMLSVILFCFVWRTLTREGVRLGFSLDRESLRTLGSFSGPLLVSTSLLRLALLFQSSFIALRLGYGDAGLFKVALTLYGVVLFVPSAISVPLLPIASEMYATRTSARAKENLTTVLRVVIYVGVPVALVIGFAAKPVISFLYGGEFLDAAPLAFVLAIAGFVEMLGAVLVNFVLGEGRTRLLLGIDATLAAVIVISTSFFINEFGLIGVGYAFLGGSAFHLTAILLILARRERLSLQGASRGLLVASGGFLLAILSVVFWDGQSNIWVGVSVILLCVTTGWMSLGRTTREAIIGALHWVLRVGQAP